MMAVPVRSFPASGFEIIPRSEKVEKKLPGNDVNEYYPMRIGAIIKGRYQVVTKLGYGTTSTVWPCRDLRYGPVHTSLDHI
jgi:serine/threonine-protein kinase SRPK3